MSEPPIQRKSVDIPTKYGISTYVETAVYCPNCGKQTVWRDNTGDYYLGYTGYCLSCKKRHNNCDDFSNIDAAELFAVAMIIELTKEQSNVTNTKS